MSMLFNENRALRSGWWVLIFMAVLVACDAPILIAAKANQLELTDVHQLLMVLVPSLVCQRLLYRRPWAELWGRLDGRWLTQFAVGALGGALLMLVPALGLAMTGAVDFSRGTAGVPELLVALGLFTAAGVAEELLFRGFVFQRLIVGLGATGAQLGMSAYFVLTHSSNPGMQGSLRLLALTNIFIASLVFGLAYLRTRRLAMPIGLHVTANWVQGAVLGFGVSGHAASGFFTPRVEGAPDWLTGGSIGLEASAPGLVCIGLLAVGVWRWLPNTTRPAGPDRTPVWSDR